MPGMTAFTPLPGSSISSPQVLDVSPSKLRQAASGSSARPFRASASSRMIQSVRPARVTPSSAFW